jgi:hypothetical protein
MPIRDPAARLEYFREYHRRNREKRNAQSRRRHFADGKRARERALAWRRTNTERERARQRRYYEANRERIKTQNRARYYQQKAMAILPHHRKGDPAEVAKRLLAKATQAAKYGYTGKLTPGGF